MSSLSKPAADFEVTEDLVRLLLAQQAPQWRELPLDFVAAGWDNEVYRLGSELSVRLPRRHEAIALVVNEHTWVGDFGRLLDPVRVPEVLVRGRPTDGYPSPWSVTAWIDGSPAHEAAPGSARDVNLAVELGAAVARLAHREAPAELPRNAVRGCPLRDRVPAFDGRESVVRSAGGDWDALQRLVRIGVQAPGFSGEARWVHGDIHPGNVILAAEGSLAGIVDFGDLCSGDPACDVAAGWWFFDGDARSAFFSAVGVDEPMRRRAAGWVGVLASAYLQSSADVPWLARTAHEGVRRALEDFAD